MIQNANSRARGISVLGCALVAGLLSASGAAHAQRLGDYLKVSGLPYGQVLWVRDKPTLAGRRIGFLPSTARHVRNYGCKRLATGRWCEIRYRGARGWASRRFLATDRARRA